MAEKVLRKGEDKLLLALASGETIRAAAASAGITERTVARRLEEEEFRRQVAQLRAAMIDSAMGRMADGMADAATTLRKLLRAKAESVRLGAARSLLELTIRLRDNIDFEERITALEQRVEQRSTRRRP